MKKHLETWWKSCSHPRDQLSPVPPDEYASRFVKFIRANVKTREEVAQEKAEEIRPSSPLTTIEEQEDRRILDRAQKQLRKGSAGHEEKEEFDVGRARTLSPDEERPEQVLPTVTLHKSGGHSTDDSVRTVTESENGVGFTGKPMVRSPVQEVSLGIQEKNMRVQEDGSLMKRHVEV
jgi:hypothetical protein